MECRHAQATLGRAPQQLLALLSEAQTPNSPNPSLVFGGALIFRGRCSGNTCFYVWCRARASLAGQPQTSMLHVATVKALGPPPFALRPVALRPHRRHPVVFDSSLATSWRHTCPRTSWTSSTAGRSKARPRLKSTAFLRGAVRSRAKL